jgi:septum formation protein
LDLTIQQKREYLNPVYQFKGKKIILASGSPRRIDILRSIGLQFESYPAEIEESFTNNDDVLESVQKIAQSKAEWVWERTKADLVIAADTVVRQGKRIFLKPKDGNEAYQILKSLSGKSHQVLTGFCIITPQHKIRDFESTTVHFHSLSDDEINSYIQSGEPLDKAGAYGIQGLAALFVKKIEGCYLNVMGFPLGKFFQCLKSIRY